MSASASEPISDAQWAAEEAIAALQDGRYDLGAAFAATAARAARHETARPVRAAIAAPQRLPDPPLYEDATGALGDTQTRMQTPEPSSDATQVLPSSRCVAQVVARGPGISRVEQCWKVITWDGMQWRHIDPSIDDHEPVPGGHE